MGLPKSRDGTFPVADWFWIGWTPALEGRASAHEIELGDDALAAILS
jgi:hypothetical protein